MSRVLAGDAAREFSVCADVAQSPSQSRCGLDLATRVGMSTRCGAALGLLLLLTSAVSAQRAGTNALATAKTLRCAFHLLAAGGWTNGAARAEVKPAALTMVFASIDTDEGTAESIGRFGRSAIVARLSAGTIHFMQSFNDGPLHVTTVFSGGNRAGRLNAVHTRHEYADVHVPGFTSSPEQYYGECAVE